MSMETALFMLASDKLVRLVFKEIADNRSVLFKDIQEKLVSGSPMEHIEIKPRIENAVKILKDAELIKERPALIEDFNTYYVTADGLNAERKLRLAGLDFTLP